MRDFTDRLLIDEAQGNSVTQRPTAFCPSTLNKYRNTFMIISLIMNSQTLMNECDVAQHHKHTEGEERRAIIKKMELFYFSE